MSIGYYINLKHREDRKVHFEKIKSKFPFFKNVKRFNAIINANGALGCSMSHHAVLSLLEEETRDMPENTNVIVCEDDFFKCLNLCFIYTNEPSNVITDIQLNIIKYSSFTII